MSTAHLLSWLEPTGLSRSDGKCPDGVTLVPWRSGRLLVWDAICLNRFSPSHLPSATREAGAVAALAERSRQEKYTALNQCHNFTPVAIETSSFLRDLGWHLKQVTGEAMSFSYLRQRLSIAVQRGMILAMALILVLVIWNVSWFWVHFRGPTHCYIHICLCLMLCMHALRYIHMH